MLIKNIKLSHKVRVSGRINIKFLPFLLVLLLVSYWVYILPKPIPPKFHINNTSTLINAEPKFDSELIPQPTFLLASHASTLEVLPNGELIALWFAGSHEGKPDVKIWQSIFDGKKWSEAKMVVSPELLTQVDHRYVKKVGNPVIYLASNGILHLFVVTVSMVGGWSASNLNHFTSYDMGKSWQGGHKLLLSPFINISTLARTRAIALQDGGFYLPVYHELMRKYPEVLRFDKDGQFIGQMRLSGQNHLLQPAILPISADEAMVYLRNGTIKDSTLYYQETNNGGLSWSNLQSTNLMNQDSSLVVTETKAGQYLMLHNLGPRSRLAMAISSDGIKWQNIYLLENTPSEEFSYPAIQVHNAIIDITYTWNRKKIKHVRFNQAWLEQQIKHGDINVN